MGKKYLDTKQNTLEAAVLQVWQVAAEEMDPVNPKAAAKKFKDRKDKDIDNDGDVDDSDEYLHKRRKAIGKAMKSEGKENVNEVLPALAMMAAKPVAKMVAKKVAKKAAKVGAGMAAGALAKKAIGKAMTKKKEPQMREAKQKPMVSFDREGVHVMNGSGEIHKTFKDKKLAMAYFKKNYDKLMKEGLEDSPNPANSQHLCAKNVVHEEWGEGQPVHGMHAMPDVDGNIAWYDVMFEHGIEKGVSINELKVTVAEKHHNHGGKKKNEGAMKRGKDMDTFKPKPQNEEVELEKHREFKVQSMRDAMEQVWARSVEDKLFEDIDRMSDAQFDEFVDSLNEEELDEILGRFTAAGQARRAIAKRDKAQQKLKDTKTAVQARKDTKRAKLRTMAVKRLEKRRNPGIIKRATSKIGDVATKAKDALMR